MLFIAVNEVSIKHFKEFDQFSRTKFSFSRSFKCPRNEFDQFSRANSRFQGVLSVPRNEISNSSTFQRVLGSARAVNSTK